MVVEFLFDGPQTENYEKANKGKEVLAKVSH
jgi:hypothetical protein